MHEFRRTLLDLWNRGKREALLREDNLFNLYHSPQTVESLLYYSFYIETGK